MMMKMITGMTPTQTSLRNESNNNRKNSYHHNSDNNNNNYINNHNTILNDYHSSAIHREHHRTSNTLCNSDDVRGSIWFEYRYEVIKFRINCDFYNTQTASTRWVPTGA
eukprot:GHVU01016294.1.p1 GENE.GHVU01016294.1~~GHVU01016294.1.p1  ORF type:complete len:109 (-),score=6.39 GHVU01016294.1:3-329(-)